MSQLTQALEVVKDLQRIRTRLIRTKTETREILRKADGTIPERLWQDLAYASSSVQDLIDAIDRFNSDSEI